MTRSDVQMTQVAASRTPDRRQPRASRLRFFRSAAALVPLLAGCGGAELLRCDAGAEMRSLAGCGPFPVWGRLFSLRVAASLSSAFIYAARAGPRLPAGHAQRTAARCRPPLAKNLPRPAGRRSRSVACSGANSRAARGALLRLAAAAEQPRRNPESGLLSVKPAAASSHCHDDSGIFCTERRARSSHVVQLAPIPADGERCRRSNCGIRWSLDESSRQVERLHRMRLPVRRDQTSFREVSRREASTSQGARNDVWCFSLVATFYIEL